MRASFTQWLLQQAGRDDPVGDLANDVARDPDWPASGRGLSRFLVYLRNHGACAAAVQALRLAWQEWKETNHGPILP